MTPMTDIDTPTADGLVGAPRPIARAIRAEFLNMRSTPTATALLAGSVAMAAASCIANLAVIDRDQLAEPDSVRIAMHASTVATLVFALVAGVVSSTTDFRFGRVDQLLLSEPNRSRMLASKASVGAITGMLYGAFGAMTAVGATASYFAYRDASLDLMSATVIRPVAGVMVGAALFAAIGIGVGTAVMNQPAAIAGSLAIILIVEPTALLGLPALGRWLPGATGLALTNSPDPNLLSQVTGGLLLAAWTCVALAAGSHRLHTADL